MDGATNFAEYASPDTSPLDLWRQMSPYGDMTSTPLPPSPSELAILKLLWREGEKSVGEIHGVIGEELAWSRSSTRKTLERMVAKGLLTSERLHGLAVFRAEAQKIPTLAGMIQTFAANVLGLEGPLPVSNLIKSQVLNPTELAELDAYLRAEAERTRSGDE